MKLRVSRGRETSGDTLMLTLRGRSDGSDNRGRRWSSSRSRSPNNPRPRLASRHPEADNACGHSRSACEHQEDPAPVIVLTVAIVGLLLFPINHP